MKKTIIMGIISASIIFLLASCSSGVSQEQYKKATDDLSNAQSQIQTLQVQLSSAQTQIEALKTQVSSAQVQNQTSQSDLQSANNKISRAKILADLVNSLMQVGLAGGTLTQAQQADVYVQMANSVKAIADPPLSSKFDSFMNSINTSQESQITNDFVMYLFSLQSKLLQ